MFFRKTKLKLGIYKCLVDAAIEPEMANELVYKYNIKPFFNGIDKFTKGLTNQHGAIIGSIVMADSFVKEAQRQTKSDIRDRRLYDMLLAKEYLTQAFIIMLKDASPNWKPLARAYVSAISFFCLERDLSPQEQLDAEENFNPTNLTINEHKIEQVQRKKDSQDLLAGRR